MKILEVVQRLSSFDREHLLKHVNIDFYLDNQDNLLGITNEEYLAEYIEKNKHLEIFQDILKIVEINFISVPISIFKFIQSFSYYKDILSKHWNSKELKYYRVYELTRLMYGFERLNCTNFNSIKSVFNKIPIGYRKHDILILIDNLHSDVDIDKMMNLHNYIFFHCVYYKDLNMFQEFIDRLKHLQILHILGNLLLPYEECKLFPVEIGIIPNRSINFYGILVYFNLLNFLEYLITKIDMSEEFYLFEKKEAVQEFKYFSYGRSDIDSKCFHQAVLQNKPDFIRFFLKNGFTIYKGVNTFTDIIEYLDHVSKDALLNLELKELLNENYDFIKAISMNDDYTTVNCRDFEIFHRYTKENKNLIMNPLIFAVYRDDVSLAKFLLNTKKVNPNSKNYLGYNAAFYVKSVQMMDLLLRYKVNFNQVCYHAGDTPAFKIDVNLVWNLLNRKLIHPNHRNFKGENLISLNFQSLYKWIEYGININILINGQDLYDKVKNSLSIKTEITNTLFQLGIRGFEKYRKPKFYLPVDKTKYHGCTTLGLDVIDETNDHKLLLFKNYEFQPNTKQHVQEPMCVMIDELQEIYFKENKFGDFTWRQPNDGNARLGFPIIKSKDVLKDLIDVLEHLPIDIPKMSIFPIDHQAGFDELSNKQKLIKGTISYIEKNMKNHFKEIDTMNIENVNRYQELSIIQRRILFRFMYTMFELGMHIRRWPGGTKPYPMRFDTGGVVYFSDGLTRTISKAEKLGFLLKDQEASDVVVPEKLSILTDYMQENILIKPFQNILDCRGNVLQILKCIYNNINIIKVLQDLNVEIDPINKYVNGSTDTIPDTSNLSKDLIFNYIRERLNRNKPVYELYKNLFKYDIPAFLQFSNLNKDKEVKIINTGTKLYNLLDGIRTTLTGVGYNYRLGNCIQLNGLKFIISAIHFLENFEEYYIEGFNIEEFRYMHY